MHNQKIFIFVLGLFVVLYLGVFSKFMPIGYTASLSNVSATISNPRPSFFGILGAGNTVGSSLLTINTASSFPSKSSAQLVEGDSLLIGPNGSGVLSQYTVTNITSNSIVNLASALATGHADDGDQIISTQSSVLTVRLKTVSAVANGSFRILIPALTNNTNAGDGLPDQGYFDLGDSAHRPTIACPASITGYTFGSPTVSVSSVTIAGVDYHAFTCPYTGAGAVGTIFDGTGNGYFQIGSTGGNKLINPAPASGHTAGTADTYSIIVQHLDSSSNVVDQTTTRIGVIEAVRVTAEVAPQISFTITGVASGTSVCGLTTNITTTATSVPFGTLAISSFTTGAQTLAVSTNASNGYAVTAIANDQLGLNGNTCVGDNTGPNCIRDTIGNDGLMTHSNADEWTATSAKGFGYTLHNLNGSGTTPAFSYNSASGSCTTTNCYRQFADAENTTTELPQTIFSSTSVADNHNLYVCYKAIIPPTQSAGLYENYITYTATATF